METARSSSSPKKGKFVLQIGRGGVEADSNDTTHVSRAAGVAVYPKTNELFVADGYGNRRVIVFDADTGAYKRHWGAYGNRPDDGASTRASGYRTWAAAVQHAARHRHRR